jgi:hypothetical protein
VNPETGSGSDSRANLLLVERFAGAGNDHDAEDDGSGCSHGRQRGWSELLKNPKAAFVLAVSVLGLGELLRGRLPDLQTEA